MKQIEERAGAMNYLLYEIGPWALPTAAACAVIGSLILTPLTRFPGILTYFINAILLFGGGVAGNILGRHYELPITQVLEKPVMLSMAGMTVTGILILVIFFRHKRA